MSMPTSMKKKKRCKPRTRLRIHLLWVSAMIATISFLGCISAALETSSSHQNDNVLNIHMVPHTHDDVGWLKTPDQYYYGRNNTIQHAGVQYILQTLLYALPLNPHRKFTYVEQAFFSRFYNSLAPDQKTAIKDLISNGQLNFANGGWVMHDEATTHFIAMMDQTTLGHRFLKEEFDYIPKTGWQLDPFGHSASQASLFTSKVGFDALYFGRIDYQDLAFRYATNECEGIWSSSNNFDAAVFWGLTGSYGGNYGPPPGFGFDSYHDHDEVVDESNAVMRAEEFLKLVVEQGKRTKGNDVMMTMGSDFQYENAFENFSSLDMLISTLNTHTFPSSLLHPFTSIRSFYSTPDIYTKSKAKHVWNTKTRDFFPYANCPNCYWTGYFTSRSGLKRMERFSSGFLHMSRQIESFDENFERTELRSLEEASAIAQHHDAVSGTSKQHVAYDYARQLSKGLHEAKEYVGKVLGSKLGGEKLDYCLHWNETLCEITQTATSENKAIYVIVYNALGQEREDILSIPVSVDATYRITNLHLNVVVKSDLFPNTNPSNTKGAAPFTLFFETGSIPALSAVVYKLERINDDSTAVKPQKLEDLKRTSLRAGEEEVILSNNVLTIHINKHTGLMSKISNSQTNITLSQEWGYYTSYDAKIHGRHLQLEEQTDPVLQHTSRGKTVGGGDSSQNSGAYIFRPSKSNETLSILPPVKNEIRIYKGDLIAEIHTPYSFITQITRMKSNKKYVDVEYTVGPVPDEDGLGKEVVTRFHSSIQNQDVFYTDSNGREFLRRKKGLAPWESNKTQPIAGSYYPINAAIFIQDSNSSLGILTDRSHGGSSLSSGSVEIMVQRRIKADDKRGVGEPLDETDGGIAPYPPYGNATRKGKGVIISGMHRIKIGEGDDGAAICRKEMDEMFSPLYSFYGLSSFSKSFFSGSYQRLPPNVMLITFQRIYSLKDVYLVRFGHQYGIGEHKKLSKSVTIDFSEVFKSYQIISLTEKTLTGNQDWSEWEKNRLRWKSVRKEKENKRKMDEGTMFHLDPMEVRTFEVVMKKLSEVVDVLQIELN